MKKYLFACLTLIASGTIVAQESKMRDARAYLEDLNYRKAIPAIDEAVKNEDTKNNAEAWFLRGFAYLQQALDTTAHAPDAAGRSFTSFMKALALNPDYGPEINEGLYSCALLAFNEGVAAYETKPLLAYNSFMKVQQIYKAGNGNRFTNNSSFTELLGSAKINAIYAAINANENDKALSLISEIRATSQMDTAMYQMLIELYTKNNDPQLLPAITEAREHYPNSTLFRNLEINYYINTQQSDILTGKLEEALKADPKNPELWFNLGNIYERTSFPKDDKGVAGSRPADFERLFTQAEQAYSKATTYNPSDADYQYNYGVLFYEEATAIMSQMNAITGTSAAENTQYDGLLAQRDALFAKALPLLEKAYTLLDPKAANLNADEKITYQNAMIGLREIYSRQNKKAKSDEMKGKLDAMR